MARSIDESAPGCRKCRYLGGGSTEQQMREIIREKVAALGSLREAARQWQVSPAYLSDVLNGRRAPGPSVLYPLGYVRAVTVEYRKAR